MRLTTTLILALFAASLFGQITGEVDDFFVLGAEYGTTTALTDSTYRVECDHRFSQLNNTFLPTAIQVGDICVDPNKRRFRVKAIVGTPTFETSVLDVVRLQAVNSPPSGVGFIYNPPGGNDFMPVEVAGLISPALAAMAANHNAYNAANLSAGGGGSDGNGLYSTSDTIPNGRVATLAGLFNIVGPFVRLLMDAEFSELSAGSATNKFGVQMATSPGNVIIGDLSGDKARYEIEEGLVSAQPRFQVRSRDGLDIGFEADSLGAKLPNILSASSLATDAQGNIIPGSGGGGLVDSTRLVQDSILVYYQGGVEIGRDTLPNTGNHLAVTAPIGANAANIETNTPGSGKVLIVGGTGIGIFRSTSSPSAGQQGQITISATDNSPSNEIQDADEVPITDAGGFFVGTDVEAATQENATNIFALDLLVAAKLDTVVVISLNDSTFVVHNYAGGSIVRSDTITISGTGGGGGGLTGTLTENYVPVANASGNLEDSFLETADALAGPNTELGLGLNTTPSGYKIDVLNSSTSGAVGGLRILYSDAAVVSDQYGIVVYEGTISDGDRRFSVDASTGDVFSAGRYFVNGDNPNIPEASSTPVLIGEVGGGKPTVVGYGTNANLYAGFYDTNENKAWSYGRRRGGAGGSGFVITDSAGVAAAVPNLKIKEGGGQVGISQIDPQYLLDIGSTASIRLNPHTSTPTGALGVQWVNSNGHYLDHNGTEYLRRVLMENAAPTDGDLLEWNATNTRWEAVAPTVLTDMNYTLNANRTATLDAITNYETFSATPAAASDYVLTLPSPGPTYEGKQVVIYSADTSGTYNLSVTAGTTEIRDQLATVTSLTLDNGETNILACMQTGAATYKWVLIGNR